MDDEEEENELVGIREDEDGYDDVREGPPRNPLGSAYGESKGINSFDGG